MDAINRFTGLRPAINPETTQTVETSPPAHEQSPNIGIASTPDAFETVGPSSHFDVLSESVSVQPHQTMSNKRTELSRGLL
ncbi:MAG TPA: hypothetical protein VLH08_05295 [Acidobacteriota bacterium]|nr:hypothetical protein [Acidobacteriota bacterium]